MPASSDRRIPVAWNTAIRAASRRSANARPAQARSSRGRSPAVKTGTGLSGTRGGFSPAMGSRTSFLGGQPLEELLGGTVLVAGVRPAGPGQQADNAPLG